MRRPSLFFAVLLVLYTATSYTYAQSVDADSLLLKRGILAMEAEKYDEAIDVFSKLLKRDSLHAEAHANLARSYKATGRHIKAANQARLAVRHDRDNLEYLRLRYEVGFINPRPLDKARKRALLKRMLEIDPENAFANTERGREFTLIYLHHRDRIQVTDFNPPSNPFSHDDIDTAPTADIRAGDPFDLRQLKAQGYTVIDAGMRADEAYPQAVTHLTTAIRSDPLQRDPYDLLMAVYAAAEEHEALYRWAKTMKSFRPEDAYSDLYLAYGAYQLGKIEEAEALFNTGIDRLPAEDQHVFTDVSRIMNREQVKLAQKKETEGPQYYWASKDPLNLTPFNERELEHYARLIYADLLFGEPKLDMRGWDSERGEMYVRFGNPPLMYYMTAYLEDCDIASSRHATRNGENNITNFHIFDYEGYRFVFGNPGNLAVSQQANTTSNVGIPPLNEFPIYSPCASAEASRWSIGANMDYVTRTNSLIREIPTDYSLPGNNVDFPYLATRFKGAHGGADLVVTYGYPVNLTSSSSGTGDREMALGLRTGAFLLAENTGVQFESRKNIRMVFTSEFLEFEGNTLWPGSHALQATPGDYTLSVEIDRDLDNSVGAQTKALEIPDYDSETFIASDLMLAYFVEDASDVGGLNPSGIVRRNGLDIRAAPWGVYESGRPVYFYFEMYNLELPASGSAQYTVEALLVDEKQARKGRKRLFRRFGRNNEGSVAVSFEGTSPARDASQYLIMDTENIQNGNYVLIVRVTDKTSGLQIEQEREVFIK